MKKYVAAFLACILLIVSAGSSYTYAARTVSRGQSATGQLKNVQYRSDEGVETVIITLENYEDYSLMELSAPRRIVLDIYNAEAPGKQKIVKGGGEIVKRIRYAQFDPYTARVVLEVKRETEYGVKKTDNGLVIYIGEEPTAVTTPTQTPEPSAATTPTATPTPTLKAETTPTPTLTAGTTPTPTLTAEPTPTPTSSVETTPVQTTPGNQSQSNNTDAGNKSLLTVKQHTYKNIEYHNSGDRVYFILEDVPLTSGDEFLEELYSGSYDDSGKNYTITFPTGKTELGDWRMEINDSYLKSFEVRTNRDEGTTSFTFYGTDKYAYFAYTRGSSEITSITVLKPATDTQKLVVIDAGHGGVASGAVYKKLFEKDINLDIAKRLNELLKKKGINTYMLREDDSSLGNYERAYIANDLNAKLFLSIHNNASDSTKYRGTMSLYCPSDSSDSFTGKSFAQIIQSRMLSSLKTVDRKIDGRPDLIVLKATTMPATIAEVAYMTNSVDRSNLQKAAFRQKAAQALCDSVLQAVSKVK